MAKPEKSRLDRRVQVLMPPDLYDEMCDYAEYHGIGVSSLIRMACVKTLRDAAPFPRRGDLEIQIEPVPA